jgi:hypothetical protein
MKQHNDKIILNVCGKDEVFTKEDLKEMSFDGLKMLCSFCDNLKTIERLARMSGSERFISYTISFINTIK